MAKDALAKRVVRPPLRIFFLLLTCNVYLCILIVARRNGTRQAIRFGDQLGQQVGRHHRLTARQDGTVFSGYLRSRERVQPPLPSQEKSVRMDVRREDGAVIRIRGQSLSVFFCPPFFCHTSTRADAYPFGFFWAKKWSCDRPRWTCSAMFVGRFMCITGVSRARKLRQTVCRGPLRWSSA